MLQKNVAEEIRVRRRTEYKSWNSFGRKLRKREGVGGVNVRIKRKDGVCLSGKEKYERITLNV